MQPVKYLCLFAILFASCRATRQTAMLPASETPQMMAGAVSPGNEKAVQPERMPVEPEEDTAEERIIAESTTGATALPALSESTQTVAVKKASSFAQMKEMARTGEVAMSKKDLKTLNKLEKKYKGDFQKFRSDAFEFTDKAKIIGGVGILGLLLAIFAGSWFGAFLFILAALAFILRYFDVIAF